MNMAELETALTPSRESPINPASENTLGPDAKTAPDTDSGKVRTIPNDYSVYEPLDRATSEIRLLILWPADSKRIRPLCSLVRTSLRRPMESYEALSYCWGDLGNTRVMGLHTLSQKQSMDDAFGKWSPELYARMHESATVDFNVTRNVYAALLHLRRRDTARLLWVDMLCINQGDLPERGHQVGLMKQVYSHAAVVSVWLGESLAEIRPLDSLRYTRPPRWFKPPRPRWVRRGSIEIETFEPMGTNNAPEEAGARFLGLDIEMETRRLDWGLTVGFHRLFGAPWFNRIWVLQEVASNPRSQLVLGENSFTWEQLAAITKSLKTIGPPGMTLRTGPGDVWRKITSGSRRSSRMSFLSLIWLTCQFEYTEPRDRLFALLGIAKEFKNSSLPLPDSIQPDYSQPAGRIIARYAHWLMTSDKSLHILYFGSHSATTRDSLSRRDDNHPSWIPELLRPNRPTRSLFVGRWTQLDAIGPHSLRTCTLHDNNRLSVSGVEFGTVSIILSDTRNIFPVQDKRDFALSSLWKQLRSHIPYSQNKHLLQSFVNTLIFTAAIRDHDPVGPPVALRPFKSAGAQRGFYAQWLSSDPGFASLHQEERALIPCQEDEMWDQQKFMEYAEASCKGRVLFVTNNGHLGIGPDMMKEGDVVAVLLGGKLPFLLRKDEEYYGFLGACFVDALTSSGWLEEQVRLEKLKSITLR